MTHNAQHKIDALIEIGAENILENTINKLVSFQIAKYQRAIRQIKQEARLFEEKYNMTSEESYQRFNTGELGDDGDFFEWIGLWENILLYQKRIEMLGAENAAGRISEET
ncbi:MAG: hypothetical protein GY795_45215 [Desulfobacterales bacterium]|nr:hypothetical protein [Desulfobacterales bacterium]